MLHIPFACVFSKYGDMLNKHSSFGLLCYIYFQYNDVKIIFCLWFFLKFLLLYYLSLQECTTLSTSTIFTNINILFITAFIFHSIYFLCYDSDIYDRWAFKLLTIVHLFEYSTNVARKLQKAEKKIISFKTI